VQDQAQVVADGAREGMEGSAERSLEEVAGALGGALHTDHPQLAGRLRIGLGGASTPPEFNSWCPTLGKVRYLVGLRNPQIATPRRFLVARRGGSDAYVEGTGGRDTSVHSLHGPAAGPGKVRGARFGSASDRAAAGEDGHRRASAAGAPPAMRSILISAASLIRKDGRARRPAAQTLPMRHPAGDRAIAMVSATRSPS
jgi:hypothetical protein